MFPRRFEITDLHPTSSNGDLDVTIDERDGNQQNYTIPYSTVPILQREGRFKFDLTAGDFRSGNSQQSSPFFSGHGTRRFTTGNLLPTAGRNYLPITPPFIRTGAQSRKLGAVSLDVTHARSQLADDSRHEGFHSLLYAKSMNTFGTNFQLMGYRYSTQGFIPFDDVAYRRMEGTNMITITTVSIGMNR